MSVDQTTSSSSGQSPFLEAMLIQQVRFDALKEKVESLIESFSSFKILGDKVEALGGRVENLAGRVSRLENFSEGILDIGTDGNLTSPLNLEKSLSDDNAQESYDKGIYLMNHNEKESALEAFKKGLSEKDCNVVLKTKLLHALFKGLYTFKKGLNEMCTYKKEILKIFAEAIGPDEERVEAMKYILGGLIEKESLDFVRKFLKDVINFEKFNNVKGLLYCQYVFLYLLSYWDMQGEEGQEVLKEALKLPIPGEIKIIANIILLEDDNRHLIEIREKYLNEAIGALKESSIIQTKDKEILKEAFENYKNKGAFGYDLGDFLKRAFSKYGFKSIEGIFRK